MSPRVAEREARYREMFPAEWLAFDMWGSGTEDEEFAWARYGLSPDARRVAKYAAEQNPVQSASCYAAIRRSL